MGINLQDPQREGQDTERNMLSGGELHSGGQILHFLQSHSILQRFVDAFRSRTTETVLPEFAIKAISHSISELSELPSEMAEIRSNQIFMQTTIPLAIDSGTTENNYIDSFVGHSLRWEAVGNYISVAGISLAGFFSSDPILQDEHGQFWSKQGILPRLLNASNMCLNFCRDSAPPSEMVASLLYNNILLLVIMLGDTNSLVSTRMAELAQILSAKEFQTPEGQPEFLYRWRRICFAMSFSLDTNIATFNNHRPFIRRTECNIIPILGLINEESLSVSSIADKSPHLGIFNSRQSLSIIQSPLVAINLRFELAILRAEILDILAFSRPNSLDLHTS